jgi:hypothetical protein
MGSVLDPMSDSSTWDVDYVNNICNMGLLLLIDLVLQLLLLLIQLYLVILLLLLD